MSERPAVAAADLEELADHLASLTFGLAGDAAAPSRGRAEAIVRMLRAVAARLAHPDAPLLVVIAGGTGAGKSTTINSLVEERVAATSVVRPTTRAPVLVHHPGDLEGLVAAASLPHLAQVTSGDDRRSDADRLVIRAAEGAPRGLVLIDTPDVDSVETANHRLAEAVTDVADAWLWFVTARTYADEVGMTYLRRARDRHVRRAVVVTQVRSGDRDEVLADVARLLADEAIAEDVVFDVATAPVTGDRVPREAVAPLRRWLTDLARPEGRRAVRWQALEGVRAAVPGELAPIVAALDDEVAAAARLGAAVTTAYAPVHDQLDVELEAGIPLRADVLDRWRDLVGAGDVLARARTTAQRVRSMVRGLGATGASGPDGGDGGGGRSVESPRQVEAEVTTTLTDTLVRLLERSSWDVRRAWERDPVGRRLLDEVPALRGDRDAGTSGEALGEASGEPPRRRRVRAEVEAWREHLAELVATVGADRKVSARRWSTALNAVATSAMLVVFAASGGLTGGEVGIAALASAASQTLLVRMFGEQNLRRLLDDAGVDLHERLDRLVVLDAADHRGALTDAGPPPAAVAAVTAAADA